MGKISKNIAYRLIHYCKDYFIIAEIERNLISQRTKEGLMRARANCVKLGRKKGGKNSKYKLSDKEDKIIELIVIEKRRILNG